MSFYHFFKDRLQQINSYYLYLQISRNFYSDRGTVKEMCIFYQEIHA